MGISKQKGYEESTSLSRFTAASPFPLLPKAHTPTCFLAYKKLQNTKENGALD